MQGETILRGGGGKSAFWWGFDGVQQERQPIAGSLGLFAQSYGVYWVGGGRVKFLPEVQLCRRDGLQLMYLGTKN